MALRRLSPRRWAAAWAAGLFFLVHLPLLGVAELTGDESLYWLYARHLDWGYLTNPPLVGWVVAASTALAGDTPLGVRLGVLAVASLGIFGLFRLGRELAGDRCGWSAVGLFLLVPLAWLYGFMAAPDVLLVALVACSLAVAVAAWRRESAGLWVVSGALLGFAFLAKYTALLAALGVAWVMLAGRRPSRWRTMVAWAGGGFLVVAPHLLWLAGRAGSPLLLRLTHHGGEDVPDLFAGLGPLHFLVTQILVWSPVMVGLLAWALWVVARPGVCCERPGVAALAAVAVIPLGAFAAWSVLGPVHPYWTGVALPAACGLVAAGLCEASPDRRRLAWGALGVQAGLLAVVGAIVVGSGGGGEAGYVGRRVRWGAGENRELAARAGELLERAGDGALLATSHGYATVAQVAFLLDLPDRAVVLAPRGLAVQLEDWASPGQVGRDAVFVAPGEPGAFPLAAYFDTCAPPSAVGLPDGRSYTLAPCTGYRGPVPWLWEPLRGRAAEALVGRLYRSLLGRDADPGGSRSALEALGRGELVHLAWSMAESGEARERFDGESPEAAARRVWLGMTGREPSPAELAAAAGVVGWGGTPGLALRLLVTDRGSVPPGA